MAKNDSNIIYASRLFRLDPCIPDTPQGEKRVHTFIEEELPKAKEKLQDYQRALKKKEKKQEPISPKEISKLDKYKETVAQYEAYLAENIPGHYVATDYTYQMVRDICKAQSDLKNRTIENVCYVLRQNGVTYLNKETTPVFVEEYNRNMRIQEGAMSCIQNPIGSYLILGCTQTLRQKIQDDIKKGWLLGKVRPPFYRQDSPFDFAKACLGFQHYYSDEKALEMAFATENPEVYVNFGGQASPTIFRCKIHWGDKGQNKAELRSILYRVLTGEYSYGGGQFYIKNDKLYLRITVKMEKKENLSLNPDIVCGVDVGMATALVAAVVREDGTVEKFLDYGGNHNLAHTKNTIYKLRKELQQNASECASGHGREKKLRTLQRFRKKEANVTDNFVHNASRALINYAISKGAGKIRMENLSNFSKNRTQKEYVLRNFCYYRLQTAIEQKAEKAGILVEYVEPAKTSQRCSHCGNIDPENRRSQAEFVCKECGYTENADRNAAINIARWAKMKPKSKTA